MVINWAIVIFREFQVISLWHNDDVSREPSLREVYYCEATRKSNINYDYLWHKLADEEENVATERQAIMYGLSCTEDMQKIVTWVRVVFEDPDISGHW